MKIKLPSFYKIFNNIKTILLRFPLTIFFTIMATILSIIKIRLDSGNLIFDRLIYISVLAILLFTAISLFIEKRLEKLLTKIIFNIIGIIIISLYFYIFLKNLNSVEYTRYFLVSASLLFSILYIGFIRMKEENNFEIFSVKLFLRFFVTILFSAIIFGGLSSALLTIDFLLNINFTEKAYITLFILISGLFTVPYFLGGVPESNSSYEEFDYPKVLRILIIYILLPLVAIYLIILYLYIFKILFTFKLPVGNVSLPIISYSILGIISLFLISPILRKEENKWVDFFSKTFYYALLPVIIMLFISIGKRILDYGVTEDRYFILIIAIWLIGIALYYIISKKKNKIVIPLTVSIISLVSVFGPWDCFNISKISQYKRIVDILNKNNLLMNNTLINAKSEISKDNYDQISSIIKYFENTHGLKILKFLNNDILEKYNADQIVRKYLNNEEINENETKLNTSRYFSINSENIPFDIKDYDYILSFFDNISEYQIENFKIKLLINKLVFERDKKEVFVFEIEKIIDLKSIINYENADYIENVPVDKLIYQGENDFFKMKIKINSVSFNIYNNEFLEDNFHTNLYLLLKFK